VDGFTLKSTYSSEDGTVKGWMDWGSNLAYRPELSYHAGYNIKTDGSKYDHYTGMTWLSGNFGWKC